jgi:hypothetical protein
VRRELQREVTQGDEEIKFALKWAEATLREWVRLNGEASLFVGDPRRTLDQNSKLWPMLGDIAEQVEWYGTKLKDYEWKDVFTAALKRHRVVPGIDGGFVVLGMRTSRMSKKDLSELIELIYAFGSEHNVVWSEPAKKVIEEHRKAA